MLVCYGFSLSSALRQMLMSCNTNYHPDFEPYLKVTLKVVDSCRIFFRKPGLIPSEVF